MSAAAGPSRVAEAPGAPQWRQFTFFDLSTVSDPDDASLPPRALRDLSPPVIVATTSPASPLPACLIVSSGSTIQLLDRHFEVVKAFRAWDNGRATALIEAGGLLLGVGEEEGGRYPVLKVWDLSKEEKKKAGGEPVLMRSVRIQHGQRPHPVSSVAITSNLSHLAVGLGDGTVLLYRHLLQSLTTSPTALTSLPKARVIHESPEPVTGLGFREPAASTSKQKDGERDALALFIVTIGRTLCAGVSSRSTAPRVLDELGAGLGCSSIAADKQHMVVARDEGVYLYSPEARGACYAYEGPKSAIAVVGHSLVITSPPFVPSASSASATVRHYVNRTGAQDGSDIAKVTVFDMQNKIVTYSGTFKDGVRDVFMQWGALYVYGGAGKLSRLDEHATSAKLDVLYRRNLYTLAVGLARAAGVDDTGVAEIHRRYGDYLYGKGDFDGAITQFVKTLGHLQPSYVIRKFLDAQRIHNLTTYLQELHARNLANPDHTTLLLNCYTKTSDRARLDAFIRSEAQRDAATDELPFELETAIRVCRQAGFYEHATYLAKKYGRHEDYLRIQIEDAGEYDEALSYFRVLGPTACEDNLARYGRTLLQHVPEATTELLIDLCSGHLGTKRHVPHPASHEKPNGAPSGPAVLSYLGYNRVTGLFGGDSTSPASPLPSNDRAYGERGSRLSEKSAATDGPEPNGKDEALAYIPPSPKRFFAHFVNHQALFIHFLEDVAAALWAQSVPAVPAFTAASVAKSGSPATAADDAVDADQRAVWNTLLELYLDVAGSDDADKARWAYGQALALVGSDLPFDRMHALVLCSMAGFTDGLVKLWEEMGMYDDVVRHYLDLDARESRGESEAGAAAAAPGDDAARRVMRCLETYGERQPHLYPLVLRHMTSTPALLERHKADVAAVLAEIDARRIMPPLAVVQVLSRNGVGSVGLVRDWLGDKVRETMGEIEADKTLVQSYRDETAAKRAQIVELADPAQPEVFQVTRCAACGGQLDLPAVHFMCKHSYHQRCLADAEPECVLCARQHAVVREVRRGHSRLAGRHDLFRQEVADADDGFGVVARAFGRGLFGAEVEA
ncbi:Vacuolar protein sorting-associated protein 11 [Cryptotrichosporon argae]